DQSQGEERTGARARDGTQRFGRLTGGVDLAVPAPEQRRRRGEDHEVHHHVREGHADVDVPGRVAEFRSRPSASLPPASLALVDHLLDLLARLPEPHVWGNRRAQDGDHGEEKLTVETDRWNE